MRADYSNFHITEDADELNGEHVSYVGIRYIGQSAQGLKNYEHAANVMKDVVKHINEYLEEGGATYVGTVDRNIVIDGGEKPRSFSKPETLIIARLKFFTKENLDQLSQMAEHYTYTPDPHLSR